MGAEPLTASTSFLSLRRFVDERKGAGAFQKVRERLALQHGVELPAIVAPTRWYPTRSFVLALDVARQVVGQPLFLEQFGARSCDYEVKLAYRVLLRFTSPAWALEQGTNMWNKAHDTGRWTMESKSGWIRGTLRDFGVTHAGFCKALCAWMTRAAQMTGTPDARVWHPACRAAGHEACVFEGEW